MKIDAVVRRETGYITLWIIILSAVMQAVFLIINMWDYTVLLGNLLSGAAAAGNFLLMGITVQRAMLKEDDKQRSGAVRLSQSLRLLMLFAVAAVGVLAPCFNTVTALVPLFFPRIAICFRPLFNGSKKAGAESISDGAGDGNIDNDKD